MEIRKDDTFRQRFEQIVARPLPVHEYCVYFTPRSGSSWLTDLANKSGFLGEAVECFSPDVVPNSAQFLGAQTLEEYVEAIRRKNMSRGTFGFEITLYQLHQVFGEPQRFMEHFGHCVAFWLIREDIVRQAVSLWKMTQTGIGHATLSTAEGRAEADASLSYDAQGIAHWLKHLTDLERATEAHFETFGLTPYRISYERMMAAGPQQTRAFMARSIGRRLLPSKDGDPAHTSISTVLNSQFSTRFKEEEAALCAEVAAARHGTLASLNSMDGD